MKSFKMATDKKFINFLKSTPTYKIRNSYAYMKKCAKPYKSEAETCYKGKLSLILQKLKIVD